MVRCFSKPFCGKTLASSVACLLWTLLFFEGPVTDLTTTKFEWISLLDSKLPERVLSGFGEWSINPELGKTLDQNTDNLNL